MLRGNSPARIDDKGRLKVPNGFRVAIQDTHGRELFVTSLTGESVRLYPMPVWLEIEQRLAQMPSTHPARQKFLDRVNFFGQVTEIDPQGRVQGVVQDVLFEVEPGVEQVTASRKADPVRTSGVLADRVLFQQLDLIGGEAPQARRLDAKPFETHATRKKAHMNSRRK